MLFCLALGMKLSLDLLVSSFGVFVVVHVSASGMSELGSSAVVQVEVRIREG